MTYKKSFSLDVRDIPIKEINDFCEATGLELDVEHVEIPIYEISIETGKNNNFFYRKRKEK